MSGKGAAKMQADPPSSSRGDERAITPSTENGSLALQPRRGLGVGAGGLETQDPLPPAHRGRSKELKQDFLLPEVVDIAWGP